MNNKILTIGIGLVALGGLTAPLVIEKDWSKCGTLTGQTVDIEKQEIRHKFAYCDEEFVIKFSDIETKATKTADGYVKSVPFTQTKVTLDVQFDKDGKIINATTK